VSVAAAAVNAQSAAIAADLTQLPRAFEREGVGTSPVVGRKILDSRSRGSGREWATHHQR
jgi:hypothetical protein